MIKMIDKEVTVYSGVFSAMVQQGWPSATARIAADAAVRALQGRKLRDETWPEMARNCIRPFSAYYHCNRCRPDLCPRLKARE